MLADAVELAAQSYLLMPAASAKLQLQLCTASVALIRRHCKICRSALTRLLSAEDSLSQHYAQTTPILEWAVEAGLAPSVWAVTQHAWCASHCCALVWCL